MWRGVLLTKCICPEIYAHLENSVRQQHSQQKEKNNNNWVRDKQKRKGRERRVTCFSRRMENETEVEVILHCSARTARRNDARLHPRQALHNNILHLWTCASLNHPVFETTSLFASFEKVIFGLSFLFCRKRERMWKRTEFRFLQQFLLTFIKKL